MNPEFDEVLANALRFIELRNRIRLQTTSWMRMIRQQANFDQWDAYHTYWKPKLAASDRLYYNYFRNWGGQLKRYAEVVPSKRPKVPCIALWSLMVIFCTGEVPLCNVDFNNRFPIGSVATETISDLWRSSRMRDFRERHLGNAKGSIEICRYASIFDSMM